MAGVGGDHYFTTDPAGPAREREIEFTAGGHPFRLLTAAGVFSAARLDPATAVLLRKAELPPASTRGALLDLGCGYGPIAVVWATREPHRTIWAVDVNERALALTRHNAAAAGVGNVVACRPDQVPHEVRFAAIYSNPPIKVGKPALHHMLTMWLPRLAPRGQAYLVVGKFLGADSLARWLVEQGWEVEKAATRRGYRVLHIRENLS